MSDEQKTYRTKHRICTHVAARCQPRSLETLVATPHRTDIAPTRFTAGVRMRATRLEDALCCGRINSSYVARGNKRARRRIAKSTAFSDNSILRRILFSPFFALRSLSSGDHRVSRAITLGRTYEISRELAHSSFSSPPPSPTLSLFLSICTSRDAATY